MTLPTRVFIGSRIKMHRQARSITREALAEAMGCEVTTIGRYERGDHTPNGEQLISLAEFFGISLPDLVPSPIEAQWHVVYELRTNLINLVHQIDDPAELERLIESAKGSRKAKLR